MGIKINKFVPVRLIDQPSHSKPVPKTIASAPKDSWLEPNSISRLFHEQKLSMNEFAINIATTTSEKRGSWWSPALMELLPPLPMPINEDALKNQRMAQALRELGANDQSHVRVDLIENLR